MSKLCNGTYTISSKESGEHRTYDLKTVQKGALAGRRILSILNGPDNRTDYLGLAFINPDDSISVWKKHLGTDFERYAKFFHALMFLGKFAGMFEIQEARRCMKCNRLLTTPTSISAGIGPECADRE